MKYQKFTKFLKNLQQNNLETVTNQNDKKYLKKHIYIFRRKTKNYC